MQARGANIIGAQIQDFVAPKPDLEPVSLPAVTRPARIRRVEAVVNPASGSVGPGAAERLEVLLAEYGFAARVCEAEPKEIAAAVHAAVAAAPDLVITLAGDGTAGLAAALAGPDGPLVAPLPGGTMNMLPHAVYGPGLWPEALQHMLSEGVERTVSGGEVDGHTFYVAAILGAPALWAKAREAMRARRLSVALARGRYALRRAFAGSLRFSLDGHEERKTEALMLMCPLVARGVSDEDAFEASALDPKNAGDAFRLGFNALRGAWREDPAVTVERVVRASASARGHIPAVLDGEPVRLPSSVEIRFIPTAFRTLAPPAASTGVDDPLDASTAAASPSP